MTLSVIIATKNRAATLSGTLETLLLQTIPVDELVIIDQSSDDGTRDLIARFTGELRTRGAAWPKVSYVFDPTLSGAGAARNVGIERACGEFLIFLDDDVLLEEDFFSRIVATFRSNPKLGGVQGIITNYTRPPLRSRLLETFFLVGPFHDERMPIYWNAEALRHASPITVRKFTSCLMSVRRSALGDDRFDPVYNGRGEDIELSWRVSNRHPLVIAPAARARHLRTPLARSSESWLTSSLLGYYYLFHRVWNTSMTNRLCFEWLKCGFALIALASSVRRRSMAPWSAFKAAIIAAHRAGYVSSTTPCHHPAKSSGTEPTS